LEEIVDEAPTWAGALRDFVESRVNSLGEYMEEVVGCLDELCGWSDGTCA
jgi:hypothetical protein